MSARLKQLLERQASVWTQAQDFRTRLEAERGADVDPDLSESFRGALDELDTVGKLIDDERRAIDAAKRLDAIPEVRDVKPTAEASQDELYARSFETFIRRGASALDSDGTRALSAGQVTENRAAAEGTNSAGGYLVPTVLLQRMVEVQKAYGGIATLADELTTDTGNPLVWPSNDDTSNVGAIVAENTQLSEQDFTFGQIPIGAYLYTSKIVRVSVQLLQDSLFDLNAFIPRKFGQRLGRAQAAHFVSGDGTTQPQGLLTGLSVGTTMGTASTLKYDDLVNLEHSVNPAYRDGGNAQYVFSDTALAAIRKVKDNNNRPIWTPTFAVGMASTINGWTYKIDNSMPNMTAGNWPIAFGDFREAYIVRRVAGASILRLTERYADYLQVGFLAFSRTDARVQNATAAMKLQAL